MTGLLAGKVAIVTGGGGGIGRGISERFAAEGAAVVIAEIDGDRARETQLAVTGDGGRAVTVIADVRETEVADALVTTARDEFGRVDVLINNVGHFGGARKAFHEQTDEEWDDLYRVNLGHVLTCTRGAAGARRAGRRRQHRQRVDDRGVPRDPDARRVLRVQGGDHRASRAASPSSTGGTGSASNAIAPDVTETLQVPYSRWVGPDEQQMIPAWVPAGRFGTPHDTAGVALFLASDLSSFVTGTTVHADGGTLAASGWFPTEEGGWTNRPRRP